MLGDTAEKSKNPLKRALKRGTNKKVTFSAPTYVEPSEYEYSTDEDSDGDDSLTNDSNGVQEQVQEQKAEAKTEESSDVVAPLSVKSVQRDTSPDKKLASEETAERDRRKTIDDGRPSDEDIDRECRLCFVHPWMSTDIIQSTHRNNRAMGPSVTPTHFSATKVSKLAKLLSRRTYYATTPVDLHLSPLRGRQWIVAQVWICL